MDHEHEQDVQPDPSLGNDLRALEGPRVLVPREVEARVLRAAHRRIRGRRYALWAASAAAAAACLFLAVNLVRAFAPESASHDANQASVPPKAGPLDLRALARQVEATRPVADGPIGTASRVMLASNTPSSEGQGWTVHQGGRVCAMDVFVDSGEAPLAGYRVDLADLAGPVKLIGVEDGSPAGFRSVPLEAQPAGQPEAISLAGMSTGPALPKGKIRIARLHVIAFGDHAPAYAPLRFEAATVGGERIPARLMIVPLKYESSPDSKDGAGIGLEPGNGPARPAGR